MPMSIRSSSAALVLLTAVVVAPAAAQADARAMLDAFAENLKSLSAEFEQITISGGGEVIEHSRGRMAFLAPNRIRWDYLEPFVQLIVGDGERLWHYDEALEQVTVRPQPAAGDSPMFVLMRPELLERFYRILPSEDADQLRFEPVAEQSEITRARLSFRDGLPYALDIFDPFGQSTRLTLIDLKRNPELDPALFEFEPPEGVDLLEGL